MIRFAISSLIATRESLILTITFPPIAETTETSVPTTKVNDFDGMKIMGRYVVYQGMSAADVLAIVHSKNKRRMMYAKWCFLQMVKRALGNNYNRLKGEFLSKCL